MKEEIQPLIEDIKIYSNGLILSIQKGSIQESLDYVKKINDHLVKVQEYLEMKKSIAEN